MIKIIEPGTRTITKCTECGCKFSYENEDIEKDGILVNPIFVNPPVFLGKTWVICPQCHKNITLTVTR